MIKIDIKRQRKAHDDHFDGYRVEIGEFVHSRSQNFPVDNFGDDDAALDAAMAYYEGALAAIDAVQGLVSNFITTDRDSSPHRVARRLIKEEREAR